MKPSEQQALRRQLQKALERLQPEVQGIAEQTQNASSGQGTTELSNAPMHLADVGTEEFLHALNATLLENETFLLTEIRAAIERIDNGQFGRCEICHSKIADERLRALPHARHCIRCATENEQPQVNLNRGRPRSPADTLADEEEMEIKRRDERASLADMVSSQELHPTHQDVHAAGSPGGGAAAGGLAGATKGDGSPDVHELEAAMGSGNFDVHEGEDESRGAPLANRRGSAISGTPATKR
jgi:RNA polymerase-binding transcription factor DksA